MKGLVIEQPIRLLQITDSHLFADSQKRLLGMDTDESFLAVVSLAMAENKEKVISGILATGDIAQDASERAYQYYQEVISQFNAPVLWLPGNHDNIQTMRTCLAESKVLISPCTQIFGNWAVVMLDSSVLTEVYGHLDDENLQYLSAELAKLSNKHVMVCLHHHPVNCGSYWLDGHNLKNAPALWDVLHQFSNVKALVWGHIHQDFFSVHYFGETSFPCFAPPSTCIQFKPRCDDFALDNLNPGYRWFDLYADGTVQTGVSRTSQNFDIDMLSTGY